MFFRLYMRDMKGGNIADVVCPRLVVRFEGVEHIDSRILSVFQIAKQLVLRYTR